MINNVIKQYQHKLSAIYDENEAKAIVITIIKHYTGLTLTDILLGKTIDKQTEYKITEAIKEAINENPVQYILGETEFYSRKFFVNENVLIPRSETEELVDIVIKDNKSNDNLNILDIGTGSGCIAVTLSCELPTANITALDISQNALKVAKQNNDYNKASVSFIEYDILSSLAFPQAIEFDIIVSNPPYVCESEKQQMHNNVLGHEPHLALFVSDTSPLIYYEACIAFAKKHLKPQGLVYVEINENLGNETLNLFEMNGFKSQLIKDMNGKNRIIKALF